MANAPEAKVNRLRGVPFLGLPPDITTGNIWYVNYNHANAADTTANGQDPVYPFKTIDYAIGQCTASNGDIIYVMPGHTEDIIAAGSITVDVAGVSIVGLGNGTNRPLIT